jgi:hypothetical protein
MYRVTSVILVALAAGRQALLWPRHVFVFAAVIAFLCAAGSAQATVLITVNKSAQSLTVSVDGDQRYVWRVSTARRGYSTPNGSYRPERLARKWYSRKYHWSPMPYSIFYDGGFAIHGSYATSQLGRPASHGCVRLHPSHAKVLFSLVARNRGDTRIVVTGSSPSRRVYSSSHRSRHSSRARHNRRIRSAGFANFYN